jgi:hypothetical protein
LEPATKIVLAILVVLAALYVCVMAFLMFGDPGGVMPGPPPEGVKTFENLSREHVEGEVSYGRVPPVGGKHWEVWQNCGFYEEPVRNETAVHSMERGAVWVTYRPDLPQGQVEELEPYGGPVGSGSSWVLVSPYPGLPAPVVASAWGKQLPLDSAEDPRLQQFVSAFFLGSQTPEPQPACDGGTSATVSESVD